MQTLEPAPLCPQCPHELELHPLVRGRMHWCIAPNCTCRFLEPKPPGAFDRWLAKVEKSEVVAAVAFCIVVVVAVQLFAVAAFRLAGLP